MALQEKETCFEYASMPYCSNTNASASWNKFITIDYIAIDYITIDYITIDYMAVLWKGYCR
jgi:hypothetical protein